MSVVPSDHSKTSENKKDIIPVKNHGKIANIFLPSGQNGQSKSPEFPKFQNLRKSQRSRKDKKFFPRVIFIIKTENDLEIEKKIYNLTRERKFFQFFGLNRIRFNFVYRMK